jgi:hypothetical protein
VHGVRSVTDSYGDTEVPLSETLSPVEVFEETENDNEELVFSGEPLHEGGQMNLVQIMPAQPALN